MCKLGTQFITDDGKFAQTNNVTPERFQIKQFQEFQSFFTGQLIQNGI